MTDTEQRYPPAEGPALEAVKKYFDGINANDPVLYEDSLNYPHTRLAGGGIRHWERRPARHYDFVAFIQQATPGLAPLAPGRGSGRPELTGQGPLHRLLHPLQRQRKGAGDPPLSLCGHEAGGPLGHPGPLQLRPHEADVRGGERRPSETRGA